VTSSANETVPYADGPTVENRERGQTSDVATIEPGLIVL